MPPLYVVTFTSSPPLSCCHFLLCPSSNFPTHPHQVIIAQPRSQGLSSYRPQRLVQFQLFEKLSLQGVVR